MSIRLGVIGANGKMGKRVALLAAQSPEFSLSFCLTSQDCRDTLSPADVMIDFSTKEALASNLTLALQHKCPIVIGTTGLDQQDHQSLRDAAHSIPVFWAPNFSLGLAMLAWIAENLPPLFRQYPLFLEETHHTQKKDRPSGSALLLQEKIEQSGGSLAAPIHSIREGDVIGKHTLRFLGDYEQCLLSHEVFSRDVFAEGALQAARFLVTRPPGFYSMPNLYENL